VFRLGGNTVQGKHPTFRGFSSPVVQNNYRYQLERLGNYCMRRSGKVSAGTGTLHQSVSTQHRLRYCRIISKLIRIQGDRPANKIFNCQHEEKRRCGPDASDVQLSTYMYGSTAREKTCWTRPSIERNGGVGMSYASHDKD